MTQEGSQSLISGQRQLGLKVERVELDSVGGLSLLFLSY